MLSIPAFKVFACQCSRIRLDPVAFLLCTISGVAKGRGWGIFLLAPMREDFKSNVEYEEYIGK